MLFAFAEGRLGCAEGRAMIANQQPSHSHVSGISPHSNEQMSRQWAFLSQFQRKPRRLWAYAQHLESFLNVRGHSSHAAPVVFSKLLQVHRSPPMTTLHTPARLITPPPSPDPDQRELHIDIRFSDCGADVRTRPAHHARVEPLRPGHLCAL